MKDNLRWRFWLIFIISVLAIFLIIPSILPVREHLPSWWKDHVDVIHLGLDLQGGMHLVLEVETEKAVESKLERAVIGLKDRIRTAGLIFDKVEKIGPRTIDIVLVSSEFVPGMVTILNDYFEYKMEHPVGGDEMHFQLELDEKQAQNIKVFAVDQALETIRKRIDQFGVTEPIIQKQGDERIVIELPGIKNTERAIELIGKTAQLEFQLVDDDADVNAALAGNISDDNEILYGEEIDQTTGRLTRKPYLLKKRVLMTGEVLTDAKVRINPEYNEATVNITFDKEGAQLFAQITGDNVGRRLAIILDKHVYSAPVIREKISGGQAQISGRFTSEEAHDLAIVLRAGALPAPVQILHQQTVGPSLGKDSIRKGMFSLLIGFVFVVLFMILYYKLSGLIADFALILNILLIMAALALLKASLTLPGIAGIVLTVGMAVDANVLIFERIREELIVGKTPGSAISAGYSKAFITIVDANVTTLIAALVLFQFGTGPIKGFAFTLSIGIGASMFTAIVATHFVFDWVSSKRRITRLSI
ncbi:MAG: protein translocase subunit SecD [bacterium]